jgi:DnaJ-class molecular chaperone
MYLNRDIAYSILNLDPNIKYSPDEIKKAYKKKALNVHPDKLKINESVTDSNEFLRVNAAYEYLSKDFDKASSFFSNSNTETFDLNYMYLFCKFCYVLKDFVNDVLKNNSCSDKKWNDDVDSDDVYYDATEYDSVNTDKHIYDINISIDVTLHELYKENGKKIKIKYLDENKHTNTHVILIPFIDYQTKRCYLNKGDWNCTTKTYGDLYVYFNITNCEKYVINHCMDKHDLVIACDISVYDYYNGFEYTLKHFEEDIKIQHTPYKTHKKDMVIYEKGLQGKTKRGDLYIIFNLDMEQCNVNTSLKELDMFFPSLF